MMNQERWKLLEDEFKEEKNFDEEGNYTANGGYPPFDLMEWLECDTTSPNWKMVKEFGDHGYRVYPAERDSFGWLVGAVSNRKGKRIYFG